MINKEIEEAKECLKETMQNTYAEGKAIKLNNLLQYIEQLENKVKELQQATANILADREKYKALYEYTLSELVQADVKANKYDSLRVI